MNAIVDLDHASKPLELKRIDGARLAVHHCIHTGQVSVAMISNSELYVDG